MKKLFLFSLLSFITVATANAATPWWLQPTICKLNPTDCYRGMGAGYDPEMWDATSSCWGIKYICGDALTTKTSDPQPMGRAEIARGTGISTDYDTDLLGVDGDCFGRRKTAENGSIASVNGKYVNVWCNGILPNPDETLEYGEITYGTQPTCASLAADGYVGIENGRCYGKYYDSAQYYIECGTDLLPSRLIVLNGADYTATTKYPTESDAEKMFDTMYSVSRDQKAKYFTE